jgi:hypothetical protein
VMESDYFEGHDRAPLNCLRDRRESCASSRDASAR